MTSRLSRVRDYFNLVWAPVVVLWIGLLLIGEPVLKGRLTIAAPAAIIAAVATLLVRYARDHEAIAVYDSIGQRKFVVIIIAMVVLQIIGVLLNAVVTIVVIYAVVFGRAVGVTLYGLLFRVINPTLRSEGYL